MHDHKTSILWFFAFAGVLLSSAAWADGYLNDRATTEKLGGVGNYLFYHSPSSSETARDIEDAASGFVETISFSQSAPESSESPSEADAYEFSPTGEETAPGMEDGSIDE